MASKQCAKFHRFSNFLVLFKLMDFAKTLIISILLHSKSLVQRARFPARISGMENKGIFSSLNTIAFFNNKLYKNNEAEIGEKIRTE